MIIEIGVFNKRGPCFRDGLVGLEMDFFLFDAAPEALDEDVVQRPAPPVHADGDLAVLQGVREGIRRELPPGLC